MPGAKVRSCSIPEEMRSEQKTQESIETFFRQAIGKESFLAFSQAGESPIQWIQLLHALDQQSSTRNSKASRTEDEEHTQQGCSQNKTSSTTEVEVAKDPSPGTNGAKVDPDFVQSSRIPEAVVAFAQAAAKTNGEPEKYLSGWPLLSPPKIQMQKCEKCSREFCSLINYRRHIRVHRRSLNIDKDFTKNRGLLSAFWNKLSLNDAKELVSFKNVSLEDVPGQSIVCALSSYIRKPSFSLLPKAYVKAGTTLLDVIQAAHPSLPLPADELFSVLDEASEKTFLCAGMALSMQKFIFDGEAGKIALDMRNLVACTSFLIEQKLVKAWVADKDAEALRCQKMLVEEEEAAQKRQAELLERKRMKKLRQKVQKAKEQTLLSHIHDHSLDDEPSSSQSVTSSGFPSCDMPGLDKLPNQNSFPQSCSHFSEDASTQVHFLYSSCNVLATSESLGLPSHCLDAPSSSSSPCLSGLDDIVQSSEPSSSNAPDRSGELLIEQPLSSSQDSHSSCEVFDPYAPESVELSEFSSHHSQTLSRSNNAPEYEEASENLMCPSNAPSNSDELTCGGETRSNGSISHSDIGLGSRNSGLFLDAKSLQGYTWQRVKTCNHPSGSDSSDGLRSAHVPVSKILLSKKRITSSSGQKVWARKIKHENEGGDSECCLPKEVTCQANCKDQCAMLIGSISVSLGDDNVCNSCESSLQQRRNDGSCTNSNANYCTEGQKHDAASAMCNIREATSQQALEKNAALNLKDGLTGIQFSSQLAEAFLAQRWRDAIVQDHAILTLSSKGESQGGREDCVGTSSDLLSCPGSRLVVASEKAVNFMEVNGYAKPKLKAKRERIAQACNNTEKCTL